MAELDAAKRTSGCIGDRIVGHTDESPVSDAPKAFEIFKNKKDNGEKVVLKT
jgi:threonine dehydrogenase-like Zn-dependent dehydrogenase